MRIQYNQGQIVHNQYSKTNTELNKTLQKLSSGYQINQAGDDAAGLAISKKMQAQINGLNQASQNIHDGLNLVNVAEGALGQIQNPNLIRARELLIQASNDTLTPEDRMLIHEEIKQVTESINDIVENTEFNTIKLLIPPSTFTPELKPGTTGNADIVFIIDKTGSMWGPINNVVNNIENFSNALKAHGVNVNFGLSIYGDINGDSVPLESYTSSLSISDFQKKVSTIQPSGGGDEPESGLEGIQEALKFNFRSDATKNFVLITDAPVHEKSSLSGTTQLSNYKISDVIDDLKAEDISLTVITNNRAKGQLNPLADNTNGLKLDINGMFGEQLLSLAEKITNESGGTFTPEEMSPVIIQSGANEEQQIKIPLYDHRDFRIHLNGISLDSYDSIMEGLKRVDNLSATISSRRAVYGALTNQLEHANNNVLNTSENLTKALSKLTDSDMAKEMMNLNKEQVLLQSAQSMMAQVNQTSQGILQILGTK
ncbi:von Willebrand factor type A domain-containing protein [Ureibacillus xyleni]|uniref:Flagellin n=1 Tax=Ureibacillus xyleni TaxID=614648 RepID=A0A285RBC9_9BACL|nr:flagellin [Ureibacillus xyleni]SOB91381.1 von Willebrand factor type A domain-containing protein [Ureibacillus xyleni]